jgi:hypothetical protein
VGGGQILVNLDGVAEFERGLLPAALLEERLAAADVFGFRLFGVRAVGREGDRDGEQGEQQGPDSPGAGAL